MKKPAPGPWVIRRTHNGTTVNAANGVGIAWCGDHIDSHEEDARLMAAAPKLLAACKAALSCSETAYAFEDSIDPETKDMLRRAIKAAGDEPPETPEPCRYECSGKISPAHGKCTMCNRNYLDDIHEGLPTGSLYDAIREAVRT